MRGKRVQILDAKSSGDDKGNKIRSEDERGALRKREHKSLMKSLTMA